jgi:hypothetical protein
MTEAQQTVSGIEPVFGRTAIRVVGPNRDLKSGDQGVGSWQELTAHVSQFLFQAPLWIRAQATVGALVHGTWHLRVRYEGPTGVWSLRHEIMRLAPGDAVWGAVGVESELPLAAMPRSGEVRHWQCDSFVPLPPGAELRRGPFWLEGAFVPDDDQVPVETGVLLARVRVARLHVTLAED